MSRAQVGIEYMIVLFIMLALLGVVWVYVHSGSELTSDDLRVSYAQLAVNRIKNSCDLLFAYGPPAKSTIEVFIPSGVIDASCVKRNSLTEIYIHLRIGSASSEVFATTAADLKCDEGLPKEEGNYKLVLEAMEEGYVDVSY